MFDTIETIFRKNNIFSHKNQGITVASVGDSQKGVDLAAEVLYQTVDRKTVLYLSGGSTPKALYEKLAREEILMPGAVGQIDERFGPPLHKESNHLMIRETGLTRYLEILNIPFYPILDSEIDGYNRESVSELYDNEIRSLHSVYQKSVGILGIGIDGHTAGVAPNRKDFKNPLFSHNPLKDNLLVSDFNDEKGIFKERVTMTFLGLSMLDLLILLVFGSEKKQALDLMFGGGPEPIRQAQGEQEIPARFYKRVEIAKKTLLITDQRV